MALAGDDTLRTAISAGLVEESHQPFPDGAPFVLLNCPEKVNNM